MVSSLAIYSAIVGTVAFILSSVAVYLAVRPYIGRPKARFDFRDPPIMLKVGEELRCTITVRNPRAEQVFMKPPKLRCSEHREEENFNLGEVRLYPTLEDVRGRHITLEGREGTVVLDVSHTFDEPCDADLQYTIPFVDYRIPPLKSEKFRVEVVKGKSAQSKAEETN